MRVADFVAVHESAIALSGRADRSPSWPLLGAKQPRQRAAGVAAFDPLRKRGVHRSSHGDRHLSFTSGYKRPTDPEAVQVDGGVPASAGEWEAAADSTAGAFLTDSAHEVEMVRQFGNAVGVLGVIAAVAAIA